MPEHACPRCGLPVANGRYCDEHGRGGRRVKPHGETFKRNRAKLLAAHPFCSAPGCKSKSTDAHHRPSRQRLVANGASDPDAIHWLVALCGYHHRQQTGRGY